MLYCIFGRPCKRDREGTSFGHRKDLKNKGYLKGVTEKTLLTSFETLGQILDSGVLVLERRAVLMVEPTELLKNFGVARVLGDDPFVGIFSADILKKR
jgi:hypothetical protein